MYFTITYAEDLASGQYIELNKKGNKYIVLFTDKKESYKKEFETIDKAQAEYIKIINYFVHGVYTFEQRAEELKGVK